MAERRSNVAKETEMTSSIEATRHELGVFETDEKKIDVELSALSGQLDFLTKQVAEFEAAQKKSNDMKVVAEDIRRKIAELGSTKEAKATEAEISSAALQIALEAFEGMTKLADEANAMKLENEVAMVEVLGPANAKKEDAIKEKEKLVSKVVSLQKTVEDNQIVNQETARSSIERVNAKFNELEEHKAELDDARVRFEEMCKRDAAAEENLLSEKRGYEEFSAKFEAATSVEIARLEELKRDRFDARQKYLDKRRSDLDLLEQAHRDDIEHLKQLGSYLKKMKAIKTMIEEMALLDENGNEVPLPDYDERAFGLEFSDDDVGDDKDDTMSVSNEAGSPAVKRR